MRASLKRMITMGEVDPNHAKFPVDYVKLSLKDISFSFNSKGADDNTPILKNMSIDIPQGSLICVCGPQGHGKSTFLQLIGQVLVPDDGEVFVPPHLRILHGAGGRGP